MDNMLLDLVRKLNRLNDNKLAAYVHRTEYVQHCLLALQRILEEGVVENATSEFSECEFCSGDPMRPLDWQYGLDHIFPDYKYCPMCGRYLKGKNENECK